MSTVAPLQVTALPPQAPSAGELNAWNQRRSAARQQYAQQVAAQNLARGQAGVTRQAQMADWTRQTGQGRSELPTSFLGRGIYKSGIFQRNLRDFYSQRMAEQQGIQTNYANAVSGAGIQQGQASNDLATTLAQIEAEEQARRSALAAEIRGVL